MQAIVITAYKSLKSLQNLIEFFSMKMKVFVHIDLKSNISIDTLKSRFENTYFLKKYKVEWGGINHLLAILDLVDLALQDPDINYIHIISEADIPVRKIEDFDFFEDNDNIYMDCTNVQQISNSKIRERYERGILFQNVSRKDYFKKIINILYKFCHKKRLGIGEFEEQNIYKGLVYISAPSYVYKDVLNYAKDEDFLRQLKNVFIPEEFFFQTIIMNSKYEKNVINHNLRYDDWSQFRNGHLPAILDITDYPLICQDEYFFARKIDYNISKDLLQKIGRDINFYFFD